MGLLQQKIAFIQANGDPITIIRPGGNISTYARIVKGRQLLSPYEINFVRFMLFMPACGLQHGDLLQNGTTGEQSFVAAIQNRTLQGVVSGVYTELYVANYPSVSIQREQSTYDSSGNLTGTSWTVVASVPMNVEHVNGNVPYKDGLLLADTVFRIILQTATPIQLIPIPDRVVIDGRNYQVSDVNVSIAPGLQIVQVKTDMR